MREAEEADRADEEEDANFPLSGSASLDVLPAAEDLMEVVVAHVDEWDTLMRLRTVSKWLSAVATRHLANVGLHSGVHTHDFDQSGVLFLLGSAFKRSPWSLAELMTRVRVFSSQGDRSSPPLPPASDGPHPFFRSSRPLDAQLRFNNHASYLLDRSPRRVFLSSHHGSSDCVGAWLALDLGPRVRLSPTELTLRHSSTQLRALRSFRLDGSNGERADSSSYADPPSRVVHEPSDDADWTPLLDVVCDTRLGAEADSTATWRVPPLEPPRAAYRFFRVVKTGADQRGREFLHLSGIECYGHVLIDMRAGAAHHQSEPVPSQRT